MRIMRLKSVMAMTGLARSTIYKYIAQDVFPAPIHLGPRAVGWLESEIEDWLQDRASERKTPAYDFRAARTSPSQRFASA